MTQNQITTENVSPERGYPHAIQRLPRTAAMVELMFIPETEEETPEERELRLSLERVARWFLVNQTGRQQSPSAWELALNGSVRFHRRTDVEAGRLINELSALTRCRISPFLNRTGQ